MTPPRSVKKWYVLLPHTHTAAGIVSYFSPFLLLSTRGLERGGGALWPRPRSRDNVRTTPVTESGAEEGEAWKRREGCCQRRGQQDMCSNGVSVSSRHTHVQVVKATKGAEVHAYMRLSLFLLGDPIMLLSGGRIPTTTIMLLLHIIAPTRIGEAKTCPMRGWGTYGSSWVEHTPTHTQ